MRFHARPSNGMSLLELLVAMAIMAMALAMLYRATGGNVRATVEAIRYREAIFIAENLLYANEDLPEGGWNEEGQSGTYRWQVRSVRYSSAVEQTTPGATPLHELHVRVMWSGQDRPKTLELATLLPQQLPADGGIRR
ncbi:prepilin-type N-terminal cleavage/methylation domain-containing protein [Diaphorobacter nitroreducens]|uniref:prepilin-type N-terminal cleavage/methylation domain-containing protein n=1 Tax=Diaphorobacter nitroreducens TaxID=164759 RepID=UPI0035E3DFCF